jgi:hypothetical protein
VDKSRARSGVLICGILFIIFTVWFSVDIAGDPTQSDADDCSSFDKTPEELGYPELTCYQIQSAVDATDLDGMLPCGLCFITIIVGIYCLFVVMFKKDVPEIQYVPYMVPAQPTPAPPVAPQPIQAQPSPQQVEAELKRRRMKNVETLRQEGRFMEAALEAETAGEYGIAADLRKQAEELIKEQNKPESPEQSTYLAYLTGAMADGFLSVEEEALLEKQRGILGIGWETHVEMLAELGYTHEQLKQYQQAKLFEDSGRFIESATLYESMGNLDKAQMLRMKAKMLEGGQGGGQTTYNISDSVVQGGLDDDD